ncbi:MAG: hypothetical protein AB7O45_12130 [Alphaproteobacteria bacterium]
MTIRLLAAALLALFTLPAHAGTVAVKNCSNGPIVVESFNSNDAILFAPFATIGVDNRSTNSISCATDGCKLRVTYNGSSNNGWKNYVYFGGACAQGPWNAELARIENCTC